jgi:hypothetical protein
MTYSPAELLIMMMKLEKLALVLASALLLGTTGAAKALTLTAPAATSNNAMLVADDESDSAGLNAGDSLTVTDGGEYFTDDEQYEVQVDQNSDLFVEDDQGDTWNIVSASDNGDQIELEYDGRTVSGDDVDS